ncbi:MAG: hypothetical protein HZC48_05820 [Nitrospirae bacterium]|nr:hypothetical protein [Nitrospirota bacterium]
MKTKEIITSYFFFFIICLSGCVPRVAPPPIYRGADLTLDEVIQKSGRSIDVLKAIADISIEKDNEPYLYISASALIKRPGQARIRTYKFGLPVNDILIKDEKVYVLSGKSNGVVKELGREFYHAVFWWDGIKDGVMYKEGTEYIIKTESKEIYLDSETLFPLRQEIITEGKSASIIYSGPKSEEGFWYPSAIEIKMGDYILKVQVTKLLLNPQIGESDLRVPDQE